MRIYTLLAILALICSRAFAQDIPVVTLGHVGHDHHLVLYLACDMGKELAPFTANHLYLKKLKDKQAYSLIKNGTKVAQINLVKVGGGSKMPQALAAEHIDIGFGGAAPVVFAIDSGAKIKIIGGANADGDVLLMRPGFGASSWADFVKKIKASSKPVRIGCKDRKAVAALILMAALKDEGITYSPPGSISVGGVRPQVEVISLGKGSNMIPSLKSGAVDGFVMNQPVPAQAVALKLGDVVCELKDLPPKGKWLSHPCCCIAAHEKFLTANPQITQDLLALFAVALEHTPAQRSYTVAARWTGVGEDVEKRSLPTIRYLTVTDKNWDKGMDNWFELMKFINQFHGGLKDVPASSMHKKVADYSYLPFQEKTK